jgi:hypothetical protein
MQYGDWVGFKVVGVEEVGHGNPGRTHDERRANKCVACQEIHLVEAIYPWTEGV